jgi:phage I-like protein
MPATVPTLPPVRKGRLPLPDRIVVCPWGESRDLAGQPVIVNDVTVQTLAANQARYGFAEVALDFDHNTVPQLDDDGTPIPLREPLPIAGMGTLSVEPGVGIIYTPLSWTPEGEQFYTGRHYRDLSPTIAKTEKGEVNFIHSVALTRKGQIENLHTFAAPADLPALTALSVPITAPAPTTAPTMDFRAALAKFLKLDPATATDDEIVSACAAAEADALAAKPEETPETTPMSAGAAPTVQGLAADFEAFRRDQLVKEATAAGKVIPLPDAELKTLPLTTLSALIAGLPATVPMQAATPAGGKETPAVKTLSADALKIANTLGLTPAQQQKVAAMD